MLIPPPQAGIGTCARSMSAARKLSRRTGSNDASTATRGNILWCSCRASPSCSPPAGSPPSTVARRSASRAARRAKANQACTRWRSPSATPPRFRKPCTVVVVEGYSCSHGYVSLVPGSIRPGQMESRRWNRAERRRGDGASAGPLALLWATEWAARERHWPPGYWAGTPPRLIHASVLRHGPPVYWAGTPYTRASYGPCTPPTGPATGLAPSMLAVGPLLAWHAQHGHLGTLGDTALALQQGCK
jgi:hypothetical protein